MEDGHLAAFRRPLDRRFCHNRRLSAFILFKFIFRGSPNIVDGGISTGNALLGNGCREPVLREGAGLGELGTATRTEICCMRKFLATVMAELGRGCSRILIGSLPLPGGFVYNRAPRGGCRGRLLPSRLGSDGPFHRPCVLLLDGAHCTLHRHFHG